MIKYSLTRIYFINNASLYIQYTVVQSAIYEPVSTQVTHKQAQNSNKSDDRLAVDLCQGIMQSGGFYHNEMDATLTRCGHARSSSSSVHDTYGTN